MKTKISFLLTLTLMVSFSIFSQTVEERFADIVCDCFNQSNLKLDEFMTQGMDPCLNNLPKSVKVEFAVKYGIDTTNNPESYKMGYEVGRKAIPFLVSRCDKVYYAFDEFKEKSLGMVDRDLEQANIKSASLLIESEQTAINYFKRALSYYKLKEMKRSMVDLNLALKKDDKFLQAYLLRGFIFDFKKQYKRAISDYKKCKELSQREEFDVFIAFTERKLREQ